VGREGSLYLSGFLGEESYETRGKTSRGSGQAERLLDRNFRTAGSVDIILTRLGETVGGAFICPPHFLCEATGAEAER